MSEPAPAKQPLSLADHFEGISHAADQLRAETAQLVTGNIEYFERLREIPYGVHYVAELQMFLRYVITAAQALSVRAREAEKESLNATPEDPRAGIEEGSKPKSQEQNS